MLNNAAGSRPLSGSGPEGRGKINARDAELNEQLRVGMGNASWPVGGDGPHRTYIKVSDPGTEDEEPEAVDQWDLALWEPGLAS